VELAAELFEGVGAKAAGDQAAQVVAAQIHLEGALPMQREGTESESAEVKADRAAPAVGAHDQRIRFADGQRFQAVGQSGLPAILIPVSMAIGAAAARHARIYLSADASRKLSIGDRLEGGERRVHPFSSARRAMRIDRQTKSAWVGAWEIATSPSPLRRSASIAQVILRLIVTTFISFKKARLIGVGSLIAFATESYGDARKCVSPTIHT